MRARRVVERWDLGEAVDVVPELRGRLDHGLVQPAGPGVAQHRVDVARRARSRSRPPALEDLEQDADGDAAEVLLSVALEPV